jgi:hypothetical protein
MEQGRMVEAGEMAALERTVVDPFPYARQAVPPLHSDNEPGLAPVFEPSLLEKAKSLSSQMGVILAQFVTFITYLIAIFTLFIAPFLAIRWAIKKQRSSGAGREQK